MAAPARPTLPLTRRGLTWHGQGDSLTRLDPTGGHLGEGSSVMVESTRISHIYIYTHPHMYMRDLNVQCALVAVSWASAARPYQTLLHACMLACSVLYRIHSHTHTHTHISYLSSSFISSHYLPESSVCEELTYRQCSFRVWPYEPSVHPCQRSWNLKTWDRKSNYGGNALSPSKRVCQCAVWVTIW